MGFKRVGGSKSAHVNLYMMFFSLTIFRPAQGVVFRQTVQTGRQEPGGGPIPITPICPSITWPWFLHKPEIDPLFREEWLSWRRDCLTAEIICIVRLVSKVLTIDMYEYKVKRWTEKKMEKECIMLQEGRDCR